MSPTCATRTCARSTGSQRGRYGAFNLGNGDGATVLEVIEAARRVTGKEIKLDKAPSRAGDPASLVADADQGRRVLGWQPARADIERIVRDAWEFEQRRPPPDFRHSRRGRFPVSCRGKYKEVMPRPQRELFLANFLILFFAG